MNIKTNITVRMQTAVNLNIVNGLTRKQTNITQVTNKKTC